jgi:hypothetical protein
MIFQDKDNPDYGWRKPTAAFILICLFGMWADSAWAIEPGKRKWNTPQVGFYMQPDCSVEIQEFVDEALQTLSELTNKTFEIAGSQPEGSYEQDGKNTFGCAPTSPYTGSSLMYLPEGLEYIDEDLMSEDEHFVLGTTRSWYFTSSGFLAETDIWVSSIWANIWGRQVVNHEFGHAVGLQHSEYGETLMAPSGGAEYYTVEEFAKLGIMYDNCDTRMDEGNNMYIADLHARGGNYYAFLIPDLEQFTVFEYGDRVCGNE